MRPISKLISFLMLLSACSSSIEGAPAADSGMSIDASTSDTGTQGDAASPRDGAVLDSPTGCGDALDIVFVLDVSTSMADTLGDIRDGISDIWATATGLSANAQFSLVVFVDDAIAVDDCMPIDSLATLQDQFDQWRTFCSSGQSPVSRIVNYDCQENSLDAIALAAAQCPWRTPATRVLIHVTDDTFAQSPAMLSNGMLPVTHTYTQVAEALVSNQIRFATFANAGDATCGNYSGAPGFHAPYMSQDALPVQTGGRAWDLDEVRSDTLNMGTAISALLTEEYCTLF